jgi:glyoxylate/hydroxypyruvate reductase A
MEIRLWPDAPEPEGIEFVIAVRHDPALLGSYPNLRAVLAMGAGVEQYTTSDMPDVPVVRLEEPSMSSEMAAYVAHWIVHFQKRMDVYLANQAERTWQPEDYPTADELPIGILGFGRIGKRVGEVLYDLGFPINAWSRTGNFESWAKSFAGLAELGDFLGASAAVVNVLPSTKATYKVMNAERFAQCRDGTLFINLGRGATVDEAALLAALESGQISNAVLDVTDPEPMEHGNPLWSHPNVRITPHVAGFTVVGPASRVIAANIRRILAGEEPYPLVERRRGY